MSAPCIAAQQFAAELGVFLTSEAMISLVPLCMRDDELVYVQNENAGFDPLSPLVKIDGSRTMEEIMPLSFRKDEGVDRNCDGSDFRTKWFEIDASVKYARYNLDSLRNRGWNSGQLASKANELRKRGHMLRDRGELQSAAHAFVDSAVILYGTGGSDRENIARDLSYAARKFGFCGEATKSALLAEMAAAIDPAGYHYSAKAAESWLYSLREYDDPATARFRLSRGILNAHRYFNPALLTELLQKSAALYAVEKEPASAAFDYLRAVNALVGNDGDCEPLKWAWVGSLLILAFDIFVRIESDLAVGAMAKLVRCAENLSVDYA